MKRLIVLAMAMGLLMGILGGCGQANQPANDSQSSAPSAESPAAESPAAESPDAEPASSDGGAAESNTVDLMGMYTVTDPEGVEYDTRVALYMPVIESDEHYADGCRYIFCVLYGLENKGVYMYNVEIYETPEQAEAYMAQAGNGEVDGTACIVASDASFFAAMESFVPDLDTWINNQMASGMMELE